MLYDQSLFPERYVVGRLNWPMNKNSCDHVTVKTSIFRLGNQVLLRSVYTLQPWLNVLKTGTSSIGTPNCD